MKLRLLFCGIWVLSVTSASWAFAQDDVRVDQPVQAQSEALSAGLNDELTERMNLYTLVYNDLFLHPVITENSLSAYKKQKNTKSGKKIKNIDVPFDRTSILYFIRFLKIARSKALPDGYHELESASDGLLHDLEEFEPMLAELQKYVDEKTYLNDGGEFYKNQNDEFVEKAESLMKSVQKYVENYNQSMELYEQNSIDDLEKAGLMREAMIQRLYASFRRFVNMSLNVDLKNADSVTKLSNELSDIDSQINRLNQLNITINDNNSSRYVSIEQGYVGLLTKANELKNKKYSAKLHQEFVASFNRFVSQTLNTMDF